MSKQTFQLDFCGKKIIVETGEIAKQASGSVLIRYEDTVVLSTACVSPEAKEGMNFFPLTVSYEEKLYSVGKIPGGFLRREGRPTEHATLTARMIDRPIRPLFPEGFRNEVQVVNTVMSVDQDCSSEMAAMLGASLALGISDIPFDGPVAGVKVGLIDGKFICNPTLEEMENSSIDLTVAGTKDAINMVEAGAKEVSEEVMLDALAFSHEKIRELCDFEEKIIEAVGKPKREVALYAVDPVLEKEIFDLYEHSIRQAVSLSGKKERHDAIEAIGEQAISFYEEKDWDSEKEKGKAIKQIKEILHSIEADEVRRLIIEDKIRPDGRAIDEVRALDSQIDLLPRAHGSAMFTRGETQVISTTTLGCLNETQIIDDITEVENKRWMHHYNFPPYSVGETGRMGNPGRREIGHGSLGERALAQVLPSIDEFPYTIRTVADVTESNGSSSQASICAATLSLMAAGVPIHAPVSGVAMGLIMNEETGQYTVLTDIQGLEDHFGDMDFKVAGTPKGITALQMDIKVHGITQEILKEALEQAKTARAHILENMLSVLDKPREEVSYYAPKIGQMQIDPDKIKDVIGSGGKNINHIIRQCDDIKIDVEEDGKIVLYHMRQEAIDKAKEMISEMIREAKVGDIFDAKVVRIEKFGAFVNLFGKTDALLHISKISHDRVNSVEDVLKIGDTIRVKVVEIKDNGQIGVSAKDLLPKPIKIEEQDKMEEYSHGHHERKRPSFGSFQVNDANAISRSHVKEDSSDKS